MIDVQEELDSRGISINNVGIKSFTYPVRVPDKNGLQYTVASINLYVGLDAYKRAVHMSRILEIIHEWDSILSFDSLVKLLQNVKKKLDTYHALAEISFPFFIKKCAPISKRSGLVSYYCNIICSHSQDNNIDMTLKVNVPICSVCPCSKAISENAAHNQRGEVSISVKPRTPIFLEDIIYVAESSASAEIYSILKRPDEKYITESSFNKTKFVEDIIRDITLQLTDDPNISWFSISVENYESIHNHNAFASVTNSKPL